MVLTWFPLAITGSCGVPGAIGIRCHPVPDLCQPRQPGTEPETEDKPRVHDVRRDSLKRIFVPTQNGSDWQRLLAKPDLHWKVGKSAMTLAASWEAAHPFLPPEVSAACATIGVDAKYVAAFPEWQVALPGGATASQTDLLVLARSARGLAALAIEGKVDEPLGPTLGEKRVGASVGVTERLAFLHETLGLSSPAPDTLRYQLFHRTVSAVLAAREFGAAHAAMVVHSFSASAQWYEDFAAFARHLGVNAPKGSIATLPSRDAPSLSIGWIQGDLRHLESRLPSAH